MELVVNISKLETVPEQEMEITEPCGFLNSQYKSIAKESLKDASTKSIFGIRRRIKNRRYHLISGAEVALKVSLFFTVILVLFS